MRNSKLNVYLNKTLTGQLAIDAHGDMTFIYDEAYSENKNNQPLSLSLPLQKEPYTARQCRPFFSGLLPEAHLRGSIARQLGISSKIPLFAMIKTFGKVLIK